ncbi:Golgi-associated plant pathogenesis-related protein 1-like [Drosophila madeirensis]|uniref:Golgi-associated plant pathogenesis-related protein 1-like n=1 Tax=Drosophila madeirensis TaxID=30013 RepID=A0AAU9F1R1_DROMD
MQLLPMYILIVLTFCVLRFVQVHAGFAEDSLEMHNEYRAKHGCPALTLDQELSAGCESYAKILAEKGSLEHSKEKGFGENLCYTSDDATSCVKMWYDEISLYNYNKPGFSMETGHFTALVWKASTKLGIGKETKSGVNYVVARYQPSPNVLGEFEQNVPRSNNGVFHSVSFGFVVVAAVWHLIELIA